VRSFGEYDIFVLLYGHFFYQNIEKRIEL